MQTINRSTIGGQNMKKIRLFLVFVMLTCITFVACGEFERSKEKLELETTKDTSEYFDRVYINSNIISKYSKDEIKVYSYEDCYFCLPTIIKDGDYLSSHSYGPYSIKKGETLTFKINDLNPKFFSKESYIKDMSFISPFVYEKSDLDIEKNKKIYEKDLLIKYSESEVIINSDIDCNFDLWISTQGKKYDSTNIYRNIEIKKGETLKFTLKDLTPENFFSSDDKISYASLQTPYVQN